MVRDISPLSAEERDALVKGLDSLPKAQATLITLHYLHNQTAEEVARTLKLSPEEFAIRHHAALRMLGRWMDQFDSEN
jgi:DNA-directed RNA polymerase specialized sigma24 family protein